MATATAPEIRTTTCALDCPDACSVLVTVENGRATKLRGNPDHPVTRGFLCAKVARYLEHQYNPARLMYPMKRCGPKGSGRFERITWDEALDTIAEKLTAIASEFGPEAILPYSYAGTMGVLNNAGMDRRFFHRLGASRLDRTICSTAGQFGSAATLGVRYSTEPEQFRHSKLIIAWGANVMGTNVHLWPFIVEARREGAKFYTIDPVRNRTGKLADKHFFVNPGSDGALALGLMHVIFAEKLEDRDYIAVHTNGVDNLRALAAQYPPERVEALTGIPRDEIAGLAREYASTRPAVIRFNYGPTRSEHGGMAARLVSMLPAITGSWREVGGGLQISTSPAFTLNRAALEMPELQKRSALGREARILNMSSLAAALNDVNDPPVKALFVYNSNPAAIAPSQGRVRQGLRREDLFTVVAEQSQTDTADFADILLPATTFLEHTDLYTAYGHHYLQFARPAVAPPGECKSNVELFRLLAARMGFDDPCFSDSEDAMISVLLSSGHRHLEGITLDRLEREHSIRLNLGGNGDAWLPFANGGFGHPDGRCNLDPGAWDYTPPVESRLGNAELRGRYPIELITAKNDDSMNSTFGYRHDVDRDTATLHLHAGDAAARGIVSGDAVRVFNDRGSLVLTAQHTSRRRRCAIHPLVQTCRRPQQRQRPDFGKAHRHGRRPHVLQLFGTSRKMRGLATSPFAAALCAVLLIAGTSCQRERLQKVETIEDEQQVDLVSAVSAGDAKHAMQFVSGFYSIEQGSWRWTRGKFAITLKAPEAAAITGATLDLKFTVPDVVIQKAGAPVLSANADGTPLEPHKVEKPGEQAYRRDIPPTAFRGDAINIEFSLDKYLAAGAVEERELGVIVTGASLATK
jgi:anaerobic selenocysteine-containing dehydrogenase